MKVYAFTGHLDPLPPGIRLPLQLSGEVYLPYDVNVELQARQARHEAEVARLNGVIGKQRSEITNLKRRLRLAKLTHLK